VTRRLLVLLSLAVLALSFARAYRQWRDPAIEVVFEESYPGRFTVVSAQAAALSAGLRPGDTVVVINGEPIYTLSELERSLYNEKPGERALYVVYRNGYYEDIEFIVPSKLSEGLLVKFLKMLVGLIYLGMGLFVVLKRPGDRRAFIFFLLGLCLMLYLAPEATLVQGGILEFIEGGASLLFLWLPPLFLHFFLIFPREKGFLAHRRWVFPCLYFPSLVFFSLFLLIPYEMPRLTNVHAILRGVYLALGLAALLHSYIEIQVPALRKQIALIVWGSLLGVLPYLVYSFYYPYLPVGGQLEGGRALEPLIYGSFIFMGAVPLAIAYAILRHRLFDIEIIVRKGMAYTLVTGLIVGLYLLVVGYFGSRASMMTGIDSTYITIAFTLAVALLFNPLKIRVQKVIDRIFYRERYSASQVLLEMTEKLNLILDLEDLLVFFLDKVVDTMKLSGSAVLLEDREKGMFGVKYARGMGESPSEEIAFPHDSGVARLLARGAALEFHGLDYESVFSELSREEREKLVHMKTALFIPFTIGGKLTGWVSFGEKLSGEVFSREDIELLSTLSRQAAIAIENARTYEDLKRTHEKLLHTERLAVVGEMAARIAHEVRNPLASIKMNIQILEKKVRLPDPGDEEYLDIAKKEIERLNEVMKEILDFSKPVRLDKTPCSMNLLLRETVRQVFPVTSADGILVVEDFEEGLPEFAMDKSRMKQTILNLLTNAQDAVAGKGTIIVKTRLEVQGDDLIVRTDITDTGKGMEEDVAKRVFVPFYTTKAKGVGLGLANVKRFVEEHGGEVSLETKVGGPTTFSIKIPVTRGGRGAERQDTRHR
jgi:signal transduction histidine kinase